MPRIYISYDERFPFFEATEVDDGEEETCEVSEEKLARWDRAMAEFEKVQDEMALACGWLND